VWLIRVLAFRAGGRVAAEPPIARSALKQGSEFTSADIRAMQSDQFMNPGML
jgi:hypothetical protein